MTGGDVALVGGGLIGSSWAVIFAAAGHRVRVHDPSEDQRRTLPETVAEMLGGLAAEGLVEDAEAARGRVSVADTLAEAVAGAIHVQENGPERLEVKQAILAEIDAAAGPETTIASSTSGFLPSALSEDLPGRHRVLVAHPVNPPHLIPLVELCPAPWTDDEAVERVRALMAAIGQSPIIVRREIDGFILNRLQGALLREAFSLVAEGYARVEDVDAAVSDGLGLRWSFMGPFETIDLNAPGGVADYGRRYRGMYTRLLGETAELWPDEVLSDVERQRRALLPDADLTARRAWRDRRLLGVVKHKRSVEFNEDE